MSLPNVDNWPLPGRLPWIVPHPVLHENKVNHRSYPVPKDESVRRAELAAYQILDSNPERVFDDVVRLAQSLFGVATSTVSLVDEERQWFKARVGLDVQETGRDVAFCGHTILQNTVLVVPDAQADDRFVNNSLVTGPPPISGFMPVPLSRLRLV